MKKEKLMLNGQIEENGDGPIVRTTYVFDGFLTKEDLKGTEFDGRQIIYQYSPYHGKPETVITVEGVKPKIIIRVTE